jgi:hypothetical protein
MGIQWFDALATKFLQLRPMATPPTSGFYIDTNGNAGYAKAGVKVWGSPAAPTALSVNGAIPVRPSTNYVITKAGVYAATLAAPTADTDDGVRIEVISNTANAHTITATGLLQTGSASVNVATFAANAGAGLVLRAYQGKWQVVSSTGITFS